LGRQSLYSPQLTLGADDFRAHWGLAIGTDVQAFDAAAAFTDVTQNWLGQQRQPAQTMTGGPTYAWDLNTHQVANLTLTANSTLSNPTNMKDGGNYQILVKQDATGGWSLIFGTAYKWASGGAPTLSSLGANGVTLISFRTDGTNMYGSALENLT
jgi:hypothetical protein